MRVSALLLAAFAALLVLSASAARYTRTAKYDGHRVYRCPTRGIPEVAGFYKMLEEKFDLDIWATTTEYIDIRVTPAQLELAGVFNALSKCTIQVKDVEAFIRKVENRATRAFPKANKVDSANKATWFEEYHDYAESRQYYIDLAAQYPHLATYTPSIATTFEGRDIFAFHITNGTSPNKPTIIFQGQTHAREWVSNASLQYIATQLLALFGIDDEITDVVNYFNFALIPILNVDGYVHTWNSDRLWRKNRRVNQGSSCIGVDINRNYDDHWGQGGSSSSPCSETYMGTSPASEIEIQTAESFFRAHAPVFGAIDWHSYSQLILRPYGWTRSDSPHEARLFEMGANMAEAIHDVHGMVYENIKSIDLYVTTGTANDWFYSEDATSTNDGIRAAGYTIELRDTGRYGFLLPPDQILPTGEENFNAVRSFTRDLMDNPLLA